MEKEKSASIGISEKSHELFKKLASDHNKSIKDFFDENVAFLVRTGIDPSSKNLTPEKAIKSLEKRIIGFIRKYESDTLKPLHDDLIIAARKLQNPLTSEDVEALLKENAKALFQSLLKPIKLIVDNEDSHNANLEKLFGQVESLKKEISAMNAELKTLAGIVETKLSKKGIMG